MFRLSLILVMSFSLLLSASQLEKIVEDKLLKVCVWPDYYSISYVNPRTQELSGIDVDLAKELAKYLEVKLEFVGSSFATLIEDVNSNKCNIAMFGIGKTPARAEHLRFTSSHIASDIYAVTTKTNSRIKKWEDIDKEGNIVVVAKGTLHEPIMKEKLKNAKLLISATPKAREQEVESGRADLFMTDFPFGKKMVESTDWAKLITPNETYHITEYAWAMKKDDDKWFDKVEEFMKKIKSDGRLLKAAKDNGLEPILNIK